jgi:general secretion pathway protein G
MRELIRKVSAACAEDREDEAGFTLVELLIVVIVLGILAAVTVFGLSGATSKSAKAACKADVHTVETAIESFRSNSDGAWPANQGALTTPGGAAGGNAYIRTWPANPGHYTLTMDNAGKVFVSGPGVPNPLVDYDTLTNGAPGVAPANPCDAVS